MAELKPGPAFVRRLKQVLKPSLARMKIHADVHVEDVEGLPLKRVYVVAKEFARLRGGERHDIVWRILEEDLSRDERFFISMVATLTPDEYKEYTFGAEGDSALP
jgi:stress-induced morphogen